MERKTLIFSKRLAPKTRVFILCYNKNMKGLLKFLIFIMLVAAGYWFFLKSGHASNDRNWSVDQAILPYAEINGNEVKVYNIRNFHYRSVSDYDPSYYETTFNLDDIKSVDFVMSPFSTNPNAAHTFLSFGFEGGRYVSISVEIRKEKGEKFSAFKGLFNQYELMYVVADERDVISLRANFRKDKVYVYPGKTSKENMQALFVDMLTRANQLKNKPEYYNSIFNTCTTNLVKHINNISPGRIHFDIRILLPGKADELALQLGLIDTDLPLYDARKKYMINPQAEKYQDSLYFSTRIRE